MSVIDNTLQEVAKETDLTRNNYTTSPNQNQKKAKGRHLLIGIWIAFGVLISYYFWINKKHEKSLIIHRKDTIGIATHFYKGVGGNGGNLYYNFIINGKKYNGQKSSVVIRRKGVQHLFVGKSFPVVYDSTDPNNNHMIIDPVDFRKYKLRFPDSLNWILPYFNE